MPGAGFLPVEMWALWMKMQSLQPREPVVGDAVLTHHPTSACKLARQPGLTLGLAPPLASALVSVRPGVAFPCGWAFSGEGVPTWGGDCDVYLLVHFFNSQRYPEEEGKLYGHTLMGYLHLTNRGSLL